MNILKALKVIFRKKALPTGVYHNYTKQSGQCWGHSISSTDSRNRDYSFLHILGHSKELIRKGDYIVFGEFGQGHRYQVDAVKYFDNPKGMFEADLSLAKIKNVADRAKVESLLKAQEEE